MTHFCKAALVAVLGFLFFVQPALAQQPTAPKGEAPRKDKKGNVVEIKIPLAILDVQSVLRAANAVKGIRDQIAKYGSKFEEEIEKERNKIRKENQDLTRQRTILAPEAFAEKRRKFEQRVVEVQRLVQKRQRELDKSRNEAMTVVNKAYIEVVSKVASENSLAVIIRKDQTAYSVKTLDITKLILDRLDKKLPTVKVAQPGK